MGTQLIDLNSKSNVLQALQGLIDKVVTNTHIRSILKDRKSDPATGRLYWDKEQPPLACISMTCTPAGEISIVVRLLIKNADSNLPRSLNTVATRLKLCLKNSDHSVKFLATNYDMNAQLVVPGDSLLASKVIIRT